MNISRRLQATGPDFRTDVPWWKCWGGHGGDEYGNCSIYFRCLLGGIVFFWDPHYQDKAEVPPFAFSDDDELTQWRRWYSEKFEGGEDLWGT